MESKTLDNKITAPGNTSLKDSRSF